MTSFTCHDVRFDVASLPDPGHVPAVCRGVGVVPLPGAGAPPSGASLLQPPLLPGDHVVLHDRSLHSDLRPLQVMIVH